MMGLKKRAFAPLVSVSLEELVPQDHFYRHLHKVLNLSFFYDLIRDATPLQDDHPLILWSFLSCNS